MKTNVIDIRGNSKYKLKKILFFLYLLNLSDLLFTKFLLTSAPDLFIEVNFFLNTIIDGIVLYFFKIDFTSFKSFFTVETLIYIESANSSNFTVFSDLVVKFIKLFII